MFMDIVLHRDRTKHGTLSLIDGQTTRLTIPCLGKADNLAAKAHGNPTRDPAEIFGDTPTGDYGLVWMPWQSSSPTGQPLSDADQEHIEGYGALGSFLLVPNFATVRIGLMIHAGAAGKQYGGLRPTYGCVRVSNEGMAYLVNLLGNFGPVSKWACTIREIG